MNLAGVLPDHVMRVNCSTILQPRPGQSLTSKAQVKLFRCALLNDVRRCLDWIGSAQSGFLVKGAVPWLGELMLDLGGFRIYKSVLQKTSFLGRDLRFCASVTQGS